MKKIYSKPRVERCLECDLFDAWGPVFADSYTRYILLRSIDRGVLWV